MSQKAQKLISYWKQPNLPQPSVFKMFWEAAENKKFDVVDLSGKKMKTNFGKESDPNAESGLEESFGDPSVSQTSIAVKSKNGKFQSSLVKRTPQKPALHEKVPIITKSIKKK